MCLVPFTSQIIPAMKWISDIVQEVQTVDTITHALIGLVIYRSIDHQTLSKNQKRSLLFATVAGSEIPDIDVVSQLWDTGGEYLMWHRGLTHSVWLTPVWAVLLTGIARLLWRAHHKWLFWLAWLAVFIHVTLDNFNAWGTGYWEPFSQDRVALGTIPIVDLVFLLLIFGGFVAARFSRLSAPRIFRTVAALMLAHLLLQSAQGFYHYQAMQDRYERVALAADFVPGSFKVIGQRDNVVEIHQVSLWQEPRLLHALPTATDADLTPLFAANPAAETLYRWSPLVVVVDDEERLGIYDPRFYRDGASFLYEYIEKQSGQ